MSTIKVKILFFASARELAGVQETSAEIPLSDAAGGDHLSVKEVRDYLGKEYAGLAPIIADVTLALNMEYVVRDRETSLVVRSGDEIALIPPISGG